MAMKLQEQLDVLPEKTHGALAEKVGISRGRVCQYLCLLKLPRKAIDYITDPVNQHVVDHITEQQLHELLKLPYQQILLRFYALCEKNNVM